MGLKPMVQLELLEHIPVAQLLVEVEHLLLTEVVYFQKALPKPLHKLLMVQQVVNTQQKSQKVQPKNLP